MNRREFTVAAGSMAVAGCSAPTAGGHEKGPRVTFGGTTEKEPKFGEEPITERNENGRLVIAGVAHVPKTCHSLEPAGARFYYDSSRYEITMETVEPESILADCVNEVVRTTYSVTVVNSDRAYKIEIHLPLNETQTVTVDNF